MGPHTTKMLLYSQGNNQVRSPQSGGESASYTCARVLVSRIYKELKNKENNDPMKNWTMGLNKEVSKEEFFNFYTFLLVLLVCACTHMPMQHLYVHT